MLEGLGLDILDPNLVETPKRVAKAYAEMLDGMNKEGEIKALFMKSFPSVYSGIIKQTDIRTVSVCPHHFLPITYSIDIGYVSTKGKMLGLSKLTRLSEILSHRAVLQEDLTDTIASTLMKELDADGVMVVVRGIHGCMSFRGVGQPNVTTITSSIKGTFEDDLGLRQEFINLH